MNLLLLHPPLLSVVVWRRLAPLLDAAGHTVHAPDLRPTGTDRWWQRARDAAVAAAPEADGVLAHSGAGVLAPAVLRALPAARAVVLIDAVLPVVRGRTGVTAATRSAVRGLAIDGVLPPWTSWWDESTLATSVPAEEDRAALVAGAPRLPEAFFDVAVPVPTNWEPAVRGYLRLSAPYDTALARARRRGWRTATLPGRHLDLLSDPGPVARVVLDLLDG